MRFAACVSGDGTEPTYLIDGREALTPVSPISTGTT
jgi:hypothetical protein